MYNQKRPYGGSESDVESCGDGTSGSPSPQKKVKKWLSPSIHPSKMARSNSASELHMPSTSAGPISDGRMRVYVRVRPENEREMNGRRVVEPIDPQLLVFDPLHEEPQYYYRGKTYKEPGRKPNKNIQFVFDEVFDEESTNMQVYESVTKTLISSFLDGYNCAVFAYGATGSGKTHTMLGSQEDPGVIFFTTMELFREIESRATDEQLELSVSYFEIYNEVVYDLLTPMTKALAVREDPKRGVVVANLSVHQPKDAQHLLEMLEFGNRNRTQHPTDANAESSRSHAIFQVFLRRQDYSSSQEMSIQLSKMSLIDLAGSERASVAYRENRIKSVQREGSNINKSLLALGNCINALAHHSQNLKAKKKFGHIPYRNSKLTLLLRDSLGGNCHTAMIATVSPSCHSYDDTHNTLTYAKRAMGIQLNLKKNNISVGLQPRNYNQAIDSLSRKNTELTEENNFLKSELNKLRAQITNIPENPIDVDENSLDLFNQHKNQLDLLQKERLRLRKQLMDAEGNLKKLDLKLIFRKLEKERNERLGISCSDKDNFASLHSKKLHFSDLKRSAEMELTENDQELTRIEKSLKASLRNKDWFLDTYFRDLNLMAESKDRSFAAQHSVEVANLLIQRMESNEELILESMALNEHFHLMLSGMNRLSEELKERFISLKNKGMHMTHHTYIF